jgi:hypothetical protein
MDWTCLIPVTINIDLCKLCKLLNYLYVPCKSATIFWHRVHPLMCPHNRQLKNDPSQPGEIKNRLIIVYLKIEGTWKKKKLHCNLFMTSTMVEEWQLSKGTDFAGKVKYSTTGPFM